MIDQSKALVADDRPTGQKPYGIFLYMPSADHARNLDEAINFRAVQQCSQWTAGHLREGLKACFRLERYFHTHPKSFEIGGLRDVIERLRVKTAETGREHGRVLYLNLRDATFVMGETSVGSPTQVTVSGGLPGAFKGDRRDIVSIGIMHSHPRQPYGSERAVEHISPQDFAGFLTTRSHLLDTIVAPSITLLLLKSQTTPRNLSEGTIRSKLDEIWNACERRFNVELSGSDRVRAFTKIVSLEFGLGLYLADSSSPNLARIVNLVARSDRTRTSPWERMSHLFRLLAVWAAKRGGEH